MEVTINILGKPHPPYLSYLNLIYIYIEASKDVTLSKELN